MEKYYMHVHSGKIATADEWINSYESEELDARGLTSDEAFSQDEEVTLVECCMECGGEVHSGNLCKACAGYSYADWRNDRIKDGEL